MVVPSHFAEGQFQVQVEHENHLVACPEVSCHNALCDFQQVKYGINARHVLEGEVLVVEHHPLLALLDRHVLDVGEEGNGDEHFSSVGQTGQHLATVGGEVQVLDT